jgi:hypothetical protein
VLEDAGTKKNRRDFTGLTLSDSDKLRCRMEVRREDRGDHRSVSAAGMHYRHQTFVMPVVGLVMEALVQPGRSGHREAEKEMESERQNQRTLPHLVLTKLLHERDSMFLPHRRQLPCTGARHTSFYP